MHSPYAWQADVDTTVVIPVLSLLYLFAVGRFGASRARVASYAAAMVLLAVAFWTPLHHLGLHYLLTAHLLQNVILAEWAPLLAVLGLSPADGGRARAVTRLAATRPPCRRTAALARQLLRLARAAGVRRRARTAGVADPRRARVLLRHRSRDVVAARAGRAAALASGARAGYAFAAFVLASPIGLLLALLPRPVYAYYVARARRASGDCRRSPTRRSPA